MHWKFSNNGQPYLNPYDQISITLSSPNHHKPHTVCASSPDSTYKLLGFQLSPSLSMLKQDQLLLSKSHHIANTVTGSSVTCQEAYFAYFSIYYHSQEMPLHPIQAPHPLSSEMRLSCQNPSINCVWTLVSWWPGFL